MKSNNRIALWKLLAISAAVLATIALAVGIGWGAVREGNRQSAAESPPGTSTTQPSTSAPPVAQGESLRVDRVTKFSGQFVENGTDADVKNVAAILVTNVTERFLDLGTVVFEMDGKEATFVVTGLPAGRSAWVLEAGGMTVEPDVSYKYKGCTTSFRDDVIAQSDQVTISSDGTVLTAVNNTDRTLENVFIYYKGIHSDGNYLGGIAYLVDFGNIPPGESAQSIAGHYREGSTEIVRLGWQESQSVN